MHAAITGTAVPFSAYRALLEKWQVYPIKEGPLVIGAMIRLGNELHIGVTPRPRGAHPFLLAVLKETIETYGTAVTKVRTHNQAGLEFCQRLGFSITHRTEELIHLRCRSLRHA